MGLVEYLRGKQATEGLNGDDFSAKLGISPAFWSRLINDARSGRSYTLICAALRAYPASRSQIIEAVLEDCRMVEEVPA